MTSILAKLNEARLKLPLKSLMEKRGRGPTNENWKTFTKCPYCDGKKTAGVFTGPHGDLFKCHHPSCLSGTAADGAAWDEIGFLAFELGLDRRAATRTWLQEAGLWDEKFKSLLKSKGNTASADERSLPENVTGDGTASDQTIDVESAPDDSQSKSPLLAFYESLSLSDADREELRTKRGLTDETIDASGFRTNSRANLEFLEALSATYDEPALVRSGLWTNAGKQRKPSGQFYGYGVVGKKKRLSPDLLESGDYAEFKDDDLIWDWKESGKCNPIIIPYFSLKGQLIGLRPHKGFPRGKQPRLYLAGGPKAVTQCKRAVIVEGEFKAAALQSVVGADWAVASVPGITLVKNIDVWGDILVWLKTLGAQDVVVVFDNEEQSNPALPSFRPSMEDRFGPEVWARVGAVRLEREGYTARVGSLPDEWRNSNGKADWDSALAALVQAGKPHSEIATLFEQVLQSAQTPAELTKTKLFGAEAEKSIRNRVDVRTYELALPWGGEAEQRIAKYLRRLAKTLPEWKLRILMLAEEYEKTAGHYYTLKISEREHAKLNAELAADEGYEQIKFLKLALKGTPKLIAPFRMIPCYVLVKPDGTRVRLVKLRNIRGECTGLIALDSDSLTAPRDFRRWLAQNGNFSWHGGERELQALQKDINFALGFREVVQLVYFGCERPGGLWALGDCAYAEDDTEILPDRDDIFWCRGAGYKLLRNADNVPLGEEDQTFRMRTSPRMYPSQGLCFDEKEQQLCLKPNVTDDSNAVRELLGNLACHLNDSFGGHDGTMLIAAAVSYFAAPELYAKFKQFPGIWITGEKGSGKTYTARWLMSLHGFDGLATGLSFKTSTAVGIQIALGQYANIPVWADEFKETELRDHGSVGVIHGGFNREVATKWSADGRTRTIRSSLLVTGESSSSNAATMSRFITVIAAQEKHSGSNEERRNRLEWLERHCPFFFIIGRMILRHRNEFVASVKRHLLEWEQSSELAQIEFRARFTYGVSYASFMALNELISVYDAKRCAEYRLSLVRRTVAAAGELAARTDVMRFFEILITADAAGCFGRTPAERKRFFKYSLNPRSNPVLSAGQLQDGASHPHLAWRSVILFFQPGVVIDMVRKWLYSQGLPFPLDQSDLLAQLKSKPYFVPARSRHGHQKKFGKGATKNQYCWAIDLDKFPEMGLLPVADEVWIESLHVDGDPSKSMLSSQDWIDPRQGPLFAIVDALDEKEEY